ncbi:tail spike protein [Proteus phage Premi]|uniref:Tail spike protein n=1 Tax=Proteus phage Premi TaxID=3097470 RepID=A0ABZ0ZZF3_9CAUD|nr:tail spike protein [Proteus phage Premi]
MATKVGRTVLHDSIPTIQSFKDGGVVRASTDIFMTDEGGMFLYLGDIPFEVLPNTKLGKSDIKTDDNLAGKWLRIGDASGDPLRVYGYYTAGSVVGASNELVKHNGKYYKTLSTRFPVTDLSDFDNKNKWLNMGYLKGNSLTDAINFSASGTYLTDSEFRELVACSNYLEKDIINSAQLDATIEGGTNIDINYGFLWNNARIDASGFTGILNFIRKEENIIVHEADSAVVKKIKSGTFKGDQVTGLRGDSTLNDSFLIIETKTPYYYYRGNTINRTEYNYMVREGYLEAPTKYPLNVQDIVRVRQFKASNRIIPVGNFEFYIGDTERWETLQVSNSKVLFKNVVFTMENHTYKVKNPTLFTVFESDHFYGDNVTCQYATYFNSGSGAGYTYNFVLSNSFDVHCYRFRGVGDGWGSTGGNHCCRVVYEKSQLSRIDFHNPVYDYMKVIDCDVGNWGILGTFIGDLHVIRTSFMCEANQWLNNTGIIRTRGDTGGWADGDLIMKDVTVRSGDLYTVPLLQGLSGAEGGIPPTSVLKKTFFNKIEIDGLHLEGYKFYLQPIITTGRGLKMPHTITYKEVNGDVDTIGFELDLSNYDPNFPINYREFNLSVNFDNCNFSHVTLVDHSNRFYTKMNATGVSSVKNMARARTKMEIPFRGEANLFGCNIGHFDFYYGKFPTNRLKLNVHGGSLLHESKSENPNNILNGFRSNLIFLSFFGTSIASHRTDAMKDLVACSFKDCTFSVYNEDNDTFTDYRPVVLEFSGGTASVQSNLVNYSTDYVLTTGYDAKSTTQKLLVRLPPEGQKATYATNSGNIVLENNRGNFTATGDARRVEIPSLN